MADAGANRSVGGFSRLRPRNSTTAENNGYFIDFRHAGKWIGYRWSGRANLLMADGHVEVMTDTQAEQLEPTNQYYVSKVP
jgi:prepilin-type processing-associated H-X9-DG protein